LHSQLPVLAQEPSPWNIKFAPRFEISSLAGGTLWRCVQYVQSELTSLDADHDLVENHLVNLEALLVKTILDTLGRESSLAQVVDIRNVMPAYIKKVLSYMQSHCQEQIQLKDLSRIGDVSERTVSAGLNRYLHTSSAQYLKQLRLKHVNDDLRCATANTTVTDVAMHWGFNQLGWFSAEYRKEFGEAPSATLRSAQLRSL
jgi:transcriptional regulator GlxA family with amidase domain